MFLWASSPYAQYGYSRVRRLQTSCHRCNGRPEHSVEQSRTCRYRQISTTARRSHDALRLLANAVRSRQRLYGNAHQRRLVLQCYAEFTGQDHVLSQDPCLLLYLVPGYVNAQSLLGDTLQDGRHHESAPLRTSPHENSMLCHYMCTVVSWGTDGRYSDTLCGFVGRRYMYI